MRTAWAGRALWMAAFLLYAWGAAPGVEWLDAGELVAAGWSLGVPHPPGEPGYALLARLAAFVPIGEVAFRVNVLSAAAAAWAVMGVFHLGLALVGRDDQPAIAGAAVGALVVALSPLLVEQATRAEVYAPAAALVIWGARAGVRFVRRAAAGGKIGDALVASLLFTLALSVQPLVAAAVALPVAAAVAGAARKRLRRAAPWAIAVGALGILALVYLPIRARAPGRALLVWGEPGTWEAFRAVVTGAAYGQNFAAGGFGGRFVAHLQLLGEGTGLAAVLAGATGLLFGALTRLRGAAPLVVAAAAVVAGAAAQRVFYPANPDVHGYLVPALALAAAGIPVLTVGAARLMSGSDGTRPTRPGSLIWRLPQLAWALALVPVLALAAAGPRIHVLDGGLRRRDDPLLYWDGTVGRMPPGPGVYFADSDHAIFPAWYERIVAGARPDVAIANDGLVTSSWFLRMIDRALPPIFVPYVDDGGRRDLLAYRLAAENLAAGRPVGGEQPMEVSDTVRARLAARPDGSSLAGGIPASPNGLGFRFAPASDPALDAPAPAPLPAYEGDIGRRVSGLTALLRVDWELGGGVLRDLPHRDPVFIFEDWQAELVRAWRVLLGPATEEAEASAERRSAEIVIASMGPEAEIATARMLARQGREAEAIARLEPLAANQETAALLLAALAGNAGDHTRAEGVLRALLSVNPRHARAHADLGLIFAKTGRLPEAIAEWRTSLALDPDQPQVRAWLAAAEGR